MTSSLKRPANDGFTCVEDSPYRFSTDDFYRMVDLDILPEGNRAYLWDGQVFEKPINTMLRSAIASMLFAAMFRALAPGWHYSFNNSITIGPDRAPTPDLAIIRGEPDEYLDRRPNATDAGLLIEMADNFPRHEVGRKLDAYASAGIPTVWIINLRDRLIHIHEIPNHSEGRYASSATARRGESFPLILDRAEIAQIAASDLLPVR